MARKIRIASLVLLLVTGVSQLLALPPHEVEFDYYADATYTGDYCGYKFVTCSGIYRYGCQTQWYDVFDGDDCY